MDCSCQAPEINGKLFFSIDKQMILSLEDTTLFLWKKQFCFHFADSFQYSWSSNGSVFGFAFELIVTSHQVLQWDELSENFNMCSSLKNSKYLSTLELGFLVARNAWRWPETVPWRRAPVLCFAKNHPYTLGFPGGSDSKESACDVRDLGLILGWRRACNPLQYSCLENPHGQRSLVGYSHGVTKNQTQLSD